VAARKRLPKHRAVAAAPLGVADAPHQPPVDRVRHTMWRRSFRSGAIYRNRGRGLVVLAAVAAVLLIAMSVISRTDTSRLSSTAAIHISRSVLFGGSGYEQAPAGNTIYYTYTVNGTTYSGVDFRRWIDVSKHRPKVCFDPDDPSSHLLVEGSFRCGIGPRA
jgi:hypothetical protein